ncbi:MAG: hypothetical protein ACR2NM_15360 [Bythopirellula sp.]
MQRKLVIGFLASLLSAVVTVPSQETCAAPAQFWLSDSSVAPAGPDVATNIDTVQGTVGSLHIWGRPETGKKLRNISLNLVALHAGIDFIDASITVYNDGGNGRQRYQYISDNSSAPALTSDESFFDVDTLGQSDSIAALQGFTISASDASVKGVGDQCVGAEPECAIAGDGLPAWLIASVDYNAINGGPTTDVHLQISSHGMNHESLVPGDYDLNGVVDNDDLTEWQSNYSSTTNLWADGNGSGAVDGADILIWQENLGMVSVFEVSSLTSVRFGADTLDGGDEPTYDASTDRDTTLAMDDPDATITIVPPLEAVSGAIPEPTTLCLLVFSVLGPYGAGPRFQCLRR